MVADKQGEPTLARIAVVGLGYVGLPLAVAFGRQRPTLGFDIDICRVQQLCAGHDITCEIELEELQAARHCVIAVILGN